MHPCASPLNRIWRISKAVSLSRATLVAIVAARVVSWWSGRVPIWNHGDLHHGDSHHGLALDLLVLGIPRRDATLESAVADLASVGELDHVIGQAAQALPGGGIGQIPR